MARGARRLFAATAAVYPMRISAVSADSKTRVHLYVKAAHRMTFTGADTWYANRITSRDLSLLGSYPTLVSRLEPGDFLTKLNRDYTPVQMTEDLILVRAANDDEFRIIQYSGLPWTLLALFAVTGIWTIYRRVKQRASRGWTEANTG